MSFFGVSLPSVPLLGFILYGHTKWFEPKWAVLHMLALTCSRRPFPVLRLQAPGAQGSK